MFYQVGVENVTPWTYFTNKFQAAHLASVKDLDMHFNMYEETFDKCDWSKEPDLSWDALLDIRAQQIAAKGKPIVLYFSGGTDSYTIYKVFERNNIPLAAIYQRRRRDEEEKISWIRPNELFNAGLYDKSTKLIVREDSDEVINNAYQKDWLWNSGFRVQFSIFGDDPESDNYIEKVLGTNDFITVNGKEKPRLKFTDVGVFSYQNDEPYTHSMIRKNYECFFISSELPELHIKQSYMLKNYVKSLEPWATSPGQVKEYSEIHSPYYHDWLGFSIDGCGRFDDLNNSAVQHKKNLAAKLIIPKNGKFSGDEYHGRSQRWFSDIHGTNAFKRYTDSILDVLSDPAGKYLTQGTDNFFAMRQFESKYYKLTF
jgi:hypothetical protein